MRDQTGARTHPPALAGRSGRSRNKHAGPPGASAALWPKRAARSGARRLAAGLALVIAAAVPLDPARAQLDAQGKSDLPGQQSVDPELDPFPFDGRLALRAYFKERLPSMWWANEPEYNLGRYSVTVHVPDSWRGNPTSALLALCPQAYSNLWTGIRSFEVKAMYKNAPWPGVTCRP
jgi:hypothetical protein